MFALKEGEVSEPVKQANGFYLIRADSIVATTVRTKFVRRLSKN